MRLYNFDDVIGNTATIKIIRSALVKGSLGNFIILSGLPGTGKSTTGEIIGLQLTCDNPVNGNPCMKCSNCRANYNGLVKTGEGVNLIKKNLGKLNSKKDINNMIKEIFTLESPVGNNVYILEEVHSLGEEEQTALLEEIDRLDKNVYVIMCTTKRFRLLEELRSRAIEFSFNRLNAQESKLLFDKTCQAMHFKVANKEVENMIIAKSKGIPRDMVKLIKFISETEPSYSEIANFLGYINTEDFSDFLHMSTIGLKESVQIVDSLLDQYTYDVLLDQFKNYILDAMFYVTGGIRGGLSSKDTKILKEIMDKEKMFKICKVYESMSSRNSTEVDFKMAMLKVSQIMRGKTALDTVKDNNQLASQQKVASKQIANETKKIQLEEKNHNLQKLDLNGISSLLRG